MLAILTPVWLTTTKAQAAAVSGTTSAPTATNSDLSPESSAVDDNGGSAAVADPTTAAGASSPVSAPPAVPPAGQAYLGAFVDPTGEGLTKADPTGEVAKPAKRRYGPPAVGSELSQLPQFNGQLRRPLSLVPVYQDWKVTVLNTQLDQILAAGGIPSITWSCGSPDKTVAAANAYDAKGNPTTKDGNAILAFAKQLKAFGGPVLLRWFPDPNAPAAAASQGGTEAQINQCLGGDKGSSSPGSTDYRAAFQAIYGIFQHAKATNVAFVWSIDPAQGTPSTWRNYFPGAGYANWIEADDYYNDLKTLPSAQTLSNEFGSWYSSYTSTSLNPQHNPLIITTAAAGEAKGGGAAGQDSQEMYLGQIEAQLQTQFPRVKGVVYFDAPGESPGNLHSYQLTTAGMQAFQKLSQDKEFLPVCCAAPVVAVSAPVNPAPVGQDVRITAQVTGPGGSAAVPFDQGGTLRFLDNGTPIDGCAAVPVKLGSMCDTSLLKVGPSQTITVIYSGDAQFPTASGSFPLTIDPLTANVSGPPSIPNPGHAYLGAFVNPSGNGQAFPPGSTPTEEELINLPSFNSALTQKSGRPLSMVHVFQQWTSLTPDSQLREILGSGGTPLIDWKCGALDSQVAAGSYDTLISQFATQLASLHAPVFLRWYYEPNFPGAAATTKCLGNAGPAGYVAAWQHIHQLFVSAGATNVAFVWCIATAGGDQDLIEYYPGSAYVDWIAADGYDRPTNPPGEGISPHFQRWYNDFSSFGKPMMVGETGAYVNDQVPYLTSLEKSVPTRFPQIRAVGYFDADSHYNYSLSPGSAGLQQFRSMAQNPLFKPYQRPTSVGAVSASPSSPLAGQQVQLTASLSPTDSGGSVSFYAQGASVPLRGCADIPISLTTSCFTDDFPVPATGGTAEVVARYNGDPSFEPSKSAPLTMKVSAQPPPIRIHAPLVPDPNQAYLGAWINPTTTTFPPGAEMKALPGFNAGLESTGGRPLSVVHLYQGWTQLTPDYLIRDALANGAIPMIDWNCGDSDANVVNGVDDNLIKSFALQLAALKAPVFLRWYYEPNFLSFPVFHHMPRIGWPAGLPTRLPAHPRHFRIGGRLQRGVRMGS